VNALHAPAPTHVLLPVMTPLLSKQDSKPWQLYVAASSEPVKSAHACSPTQFCDAAPSRQPSCGDVHEHSAVLMSYVHPSVLASEHITFPSSAWHTGVVGFVTAPSVHPKRAPRTRTSPRRLLILLCTRTFPSQDTTTYRGRRM
jgi:hypothetical protein